MNNIVIATVKGWNLEAYKRWEAPAGFKKFLISSKEYLTYDNLKAIEPRYIFFPHWSWKIPEDIFNSFECIVFHMTDLPFGRGGSPLQNLIVRGVYDTKISAIKVVEEMDGGPIYLKVSLDLNAGSAEEIYKIASGKVFSMMTKIIEENLQPVEQKGYVTVFKRRTPVESKIPAGLCGKGLYDFIRMLDAEGYPKAFIDNNFNRIEFSDAKLNSDETVVAIATIMERKR